jgi:hypothetical protein
MLADRSAVLHGRTKQWERATDIADRFFRISEDAS